MCANRSGMTPCLTDLGPGAHAKRHNAVLILEDEAGLLEAAVLPPVYRFLGDRVISPGPFLVEGTLKRQPTLNTLTFSEFLLNWETLELLKPKTLNPTCEMRHTDEGRRWILSCT